MQRTEYRSTITDNKSYQSDFWEESVNMNDYVESCCMQNGGARLRTNCAVEHL